MTKRKRKGKNVNDLAQEILRYESMFIRTWRNIARAFDVQDMRTAKKIIKKYKIPICRINGIPAMSRESLNNYFKIILQGTNQK